MDTEDSAIIVGVDGSPQATAAIRWAARDAVMHNAPLTLMYAAPPVMGNWLAIPVPIGVLEWQHELASEILDDAERVAAECGGEALQVTTKLASSSAVPALAEMSEDARMVVVGSRGRGALARTVLGSVSMGLMHHAHCPVALIHNTASWEADRSRAPVVVGVDNAPTSEAALDLAFDEASRRRVDLVALHAWWSPGAFELNGVDWEALRREVDESLADRLSDWQQRYPHVAVQRVVVRDEPARELVAQTRDAQLLVVGSRGHRGIASALLGSVSTAVVQAVRIPVIVTR